MGLGRAGKQPTSPRPRATHNLLLVLVAAAVGRGQRGGAGLAVPGHVAQLRGAADGQRVDAVGVAVAVAAVVFPAPVPRRPDEDGAQPPAALWTEWNGVTGEQALGEAWQEETQLETGRLGPRSQGPPAHRPTCPGGAGVPASTSVRAPTNRTPGPPKAQSGDPRGWSHG